MQYDRLIKGITAVFAVLTGMLTVVGLLVNPAVLVLALLFGASTYLMYYHISGKMAANVYQRVERQAATNNGSARRGGFGAGPKEEWRPPRDGQRAQGFSERFNANQRNRRRAQQQRARRRTARQSSGMTPSEAYKRLGLDPGAGEQAVKQAYREKVKEAHPDTDSGSEAEFKRVKTAYETLTDD